MLINISSFASTIPINGIVVNENKEAMPGVTVVVKGTNKGVITDIDGHFFLDVPNRESTIVISFIGYKTEELKIGDKLNFYVVLKEKLSELDEVVVVGYGSQKKLSVVGSIESVSPTTLQTGFSRSLSNNLAGKLSGIISVQRTGEPGKDNSDFWIRGISTFTGNSSPLVLVDGVERSLNDMDPSEIESFSILKDATASAVYGVRGANGVILINTKRGTIGAPKVSLKCEMSISEPTKLPQFVDAVKYMEIMNGIALDSNIQLPFSQMQIDNTRNKYDEELYPNINWIDAITKDHAFNQRVNVNINGGSPVLRYNVDASVFNENGIMESDKKQSWDGSTKLSRYNVRSNVDVDITKNTLLKINIGGYIQQQRKVNHDIEDLFNVAFNTPPYVHPAYYSNGKIPRKDGSQNPWALATQLGYQRINKSKLESLVSIEQNLKSITDGLKAKITFAFDSYNSNTVIRGKEPDYYHQASSRDDDGELILNIASYGQEFLNHESYGDYGNQTTYLEGALTYNNTFCKKHYVDALFMYNHRNYDTGEKLPYRNQGIAFRLSYSYDRRYITEFNFGYNGSENFAKKQRFGFFPSFAVGWLISEEPFMKPITDVISKLKIRGSFGYVGNDHINGLRFAYITTLGTNDGYSWGTGGSGGHTTTADVSHIGRREGHEGVQNLTWEKSQKTDIGVELGLFNDINIQTDLFYERRSNIFMQRTNIPGSAGFVESPWANYGIVDNKGFDLALEYNKKINKNLMIAFKGTFTYAKNKIIEKDEAPSVVGTYRSYTGQSVSTLYGLKALGLFSEDDFIDVDNGILCDNIPIHSYGKVRPGDIKYADLNNDGIINDEDKCPIGGTEVPEIIYGIGISTKWKKIDLNIFMQGAAKTYRVIGSNLFIPGSGTTILGNILTNYEDSWSIDNQKQNVFYPRFSYGTNLNNYQPSTWWKKDMSFIRVKTLELGYNFKKVRLFLSGNNLFCFSKFKLWDPEIGANDGLIYPTMRSYSFGLSVSL